MFVYTFVLAFVYVFACTASLYHRVAYLAIDMKAKSTPEFTFAEVSKNFIENSSASAFPLSNETFYSSQRMIYGSRLLERFNHTCG